MYDQARYLYQVAYGYLITDTLDFGNLEASDQIASAEVANTRFETARDPCLYKNCLTKLVSGSGFGPTAFVFVV